MTQYIVLYALPDSEWRQITSVMARSARSAISTAISGAENAYTEGTFLAVPARSWRPVTVKVETKTALKFST